jgi:hypothetical protein
VSNLNWRKSRYSGQGANCVEVAPTNEGVLVRDTKDQGNGPVIPFTTAEWAEFLREVRQAIPSAIIETRPDGTHLRSAGTTLRFTTGEWTAFREGVIDGEFDPATLVGSTRQSRA